MNAAVEMSPDSAAMRSTTAVAAPKRDKAPVRRISTRPWIIKPRDRIRAHWESEYERIHAWARHAFSANGFGG